MNTETGKRLCEYIVFTTPYESKFIHDNNCKFCKLRNEKRTELSYKERNLYIYGK